MGTWLRQVVDELAHTWGVYFMSCHIHEVYS
jgi:hypothetical protein